MTLRPPRILIVEDDGGLRSLLGTALRHEGFEVDTAGNGKMGLHLATEREYVVILLDLQLPGMNGYELLEALDPRTGMARPLVMVMTASAAPLLASLDPRRVHAVLKKPFDVPGLVAIVREVARVRAPLTGSNAPSDPFAEEGGETPRSRRPN